MITIQMIRWFTIWLMVFCLSLSVLSWFGPTSSRPADSAVAIFGIQATIAVGWIVAHVARLERELANYVENHSDPEATKKLAEFLRKSGSIRAR